MQGLTRIHIERRDAICLGKNSIRTEHEIDTGSKIPGTAFRYHRTLYKYIELVQLRPIGLISKSNGAVEPPSLARIERCSAVDPTAYSYPPFLKKIHRRKIHRSVRLSDDRVSNCHEQANRRGKCY